MVGFGITLPVMVNCLMQSGPEGTRVWGKAASYIVSCQASDWIAVLVRFLSADVHGELCRQYVDAGQ